MSSAKGLAQFTKALVGVSEGVIKSGDKVAADITTEALREAGIKTKFGSTVRTKQGNLPPPSVRSPVNQQQFDPIEANREDAILSGSTRYMDGDQLKMNRNYGSVYPSQKPSTSVLGQSRDFNLRQQGARAQQTTRAAKAARQSGGVDTFLQDRTVQDLKLKPDAHHRAGLEMYDWMFDGLDEQGQGEVRAFLQSIGVDPGNTKFNRMDLPQDVHNTLHAYLRDDTDIEYSGKQIQKMIDGFSKMSAKEREPYIRDFVEWAQGMADEKTYELMNAPQKAL